MTVGVDAERPRVEPAGSGRMLTGSLRLRPSVWGVGALLVLAHVGFRAWALLPSWFYLDDYKLLAEAQTAGLDLSHLLAPYNSHLMPGGRALAYLVAEAGTLNWLFAAGLILVCQALAALAALWALVCLFGARWATLALLTLYLTTSMTMPAMMWWTAAVNQVPLQFAFFLALGSWVNYLRERRRGWLVCTLAAVALGLAFYVKALLIIPVLAYVALAWFATGGALRRLRSVLTHYRTATTLGVALGGGYVAYYVTHVSAPFTGVSVSLVAEVAGAMLGTAFVTAVVGGPWDWAALAPPNAFAAPPSVGVHIAWVICSLVVLTALLIRRRAMRAWVLLLGYLLACLALLVTSRGTAFGSLLGLEYRYLTDAAGMTVACLGFAFLPVPGARESSEPRAPSLINRELPTTWIAAVVTLVALGGIASSCRYVTIWHEQNASSSYVRTLAANLEGRGRVDLVDQPVPEAIVPGMFAPDNKVSMFATLISDEVRFPESSPHLGVVAQDGSVRTALIGSGVRAKPGRREDCGWRVTAKGRRIPLTASAFDWVWWLRIGYLYSQESSVRVSAGGHTVETQLQPGVNSLYVRMAGSFDEVHIDGIAPGSTLCVDSVEVGPVVPGGTLD